MGDNESNSHGKKWLAAFDGPIGSRQDNSAHQKLELIELFVVNLQQIPCAGTGRCFQGKAEMKDMQIFDL